MIYHMVFDATAILAQTNTHKVNLAALVFAAFATFFLEVAVFRWLWNSTMPVVFGLRTLTYWQAFRLFIMAHLLLGAIHYTLPPSINPLV